MLPSMPILNLNSRDSSDLPVVNPVPVANPPSQNIEPEPEKQNSLINAVPDVKPEILPEVKEPDDDVFVGSTEKRKLKSNPSVLSAPKKKKKTVLSDEDDDGKQVTLEESGSSYAESYFLKVMKTVDKDMFEQFVSLLLEYEQKRKSRVELFKKIENLFAAFPDLVEEFLDFLQPHEALECKKLRQKNFITEAWKLFKYVEPTQMNKLVTILEQHLENTNMSVAEIKELINSLFKAQPQVALGLSSLFMNGPPPIRDDESYEKISSLSVDGDSHDYETVHIPLQSVRDCSSCNCPCHLDSDILCSACHITVFNCKVYVKKDKTLRAAKIEFDGYSTSDMLKKLNPEHFARREALEMMASSPSKVSMRGEKRDRKSICEQDSKKAEEDSAVKSEASKELVHTVIFEANKFGHLEFYETTEKPVKEKTKVVSPKKRKPKAAKAPNEKIKVNLFPDIKPEVVSELQSFPMDSSIKVEDDIKNFMDTNMAEVVRESSVDMFKIDMSSQDDVISFKIEDSSQTDTIEPCKIEEVTQQIVTIEPCKIEEVTQQIVPPESTVPDIINSAQTEDSFESNRIVTDLIEDVKKYELENCAVDEGVMEQQDMSCETAEETPGNSLEPCKTEPDGEDPPVLTCKQEMDITESVISRTAEEITKEEIKTGVIVKEESIEDVLSSPSKRSWTREEDKVILEAFRREIDTENTFSKISSSLPSRSVDDIQSRFRDLMILLERITSGDSES